ncbi:MAG: DUF115 domain-containing protein [Spirochaetes bacterium]|nr:DUF115 domain-containing protein [Spirochaetota bacterium]
MNDLLYKKNILALSSHNSNLSLEIHSLKPLNSVITLPAKDGNMIPVIEKGNTKIQLHSMYDPVSEAEKLYQTSKKGSCFIVIYGLGGGYHILPYLNDDFIEKILIIDTGKRYLRKIIEDIDLTAIFTDPKVNILFDPDFAELSEFISENYIPAVFGNLNIVHLKNRVQSESLFFEKITNNINLILDKVLNDFASQAFFGKRWFKNIINNLKYAEGQQVIPKAKQKAAIVGAGTSLEMQLNHLKESVEDTLIFASDTAAGYLLLNGITPDYIISIDCQHITYNHLTGYDLKDIPVIIELGSPLFLSRYFKNRIYVTSGNPLSCLIASVWRYFQYVDTAGGNVSYAGLSIASSIGINEITLYGVDYSYIKYKPYARDTFIYKYFNKDSIKTNSLENSIYSFSSDSNLYECSKKDVYSNKRMDFYYKSILSYIKKEDINVKGAPFSPRKIYHKSKKKNTADYKLFSSGSPKMPWNVFLEDYKESLKTLPDFKNQYNRYITSLSKKEREIWTTIYPVCATFRKELREKNLSTPQILHITKEWCISEIEKVIRE